jgi:hypothetical protein
MDGQSAIGYVRIGLIVVAVLLALLVIWIFTKNRDLQDGDRGDLIEPEDDDNANYVSSRIIEGSDLAEDDLGPGFDKDLPFESKVTVPRMDGEDNLKEDVDDQF